MDPVKEQLSTPEVIRPGGPHVGLQARLGLAGEALNPDNTELPKIESAAALRTSFQQTEKDTTNKISNVSTLERATYWQKQGVEGFDNQKREWVTQMVKVCGNRKDITNVLQARNLGGINWSSFDPAQAEKLFQNYFAQSGNEQVKITGPQGETLLIPSNVNKFVEDVIASYTKDGKLDYQAFENELPALKWITKTFGNQFSFDLVTDLIDLKVKLQNDALAQELVNEVNAEGDVTIQDKSQKFTRLNNLNQREQDLLKLLWQNKDIVRVTGTGPIPDTGPDTGPKTGPTVEQKPLEPGEFALTDIFRKIVGPVPTGHEFFIENPPEKLMLDDATLDKLTFKDHKPFFILRNKTIAANPEVIPWDKFENDTRFKNAEVLTDNDSGLLALAAVSGKRPEEQARIYNILADLIVKIHEKNPELLSQWVESQKKPFAKYKDYDPSVTPPMADKDMLPINILVVSDIQSDQTGRIMRLRPENELLFPHTPDGQFDEAKFKEFRQTRLTKLREKLATGKLDIGDIHQIEFLSHSTNVAEMLNFIKANQSKEPAEAVKKK